MGTLSVKKSSGNGNCVSCFSYRGKYTGSCACLVVYLNVDVNCCYIQVITLISNGVHVTYGTYFNVM